jgi:hypothetical protein
MNGHLLMAFLLFTGFSRSFDIFMPEAEFDKVLRGGSLDGFITAKEFWAIIGDIRRTETNALYLSTPMSIGRSYEKRSLDAFYITDNTSQLPNYQQTKNIILFTSVHHSREPLSLTMIVLMVREILKLVRGAGHNKMKELLRDNIIFFLPIMNVDSYVYINENYFGAHSKQIRMIRKNRHGTPGCADWLGGVDLNRNYDMKFGMDEEGSSSNPCSEDYRGIRPFSEPETSALKAYVDSHPNIVSDVNIHTYGNAWIYPYNYVRDKNNHLLEQKNRLFFDFYNEFTSQIHKKDMRALFGNAAFALDYSTNGEAGDWFTGKKHILNIDVELGNPDPRSEEFYPPQSILADIVRYNWVAMKEYLYRHVVEFTHRVVLFRSQANFEVINRSISGLLGSRLFFEPVFDGEVYSGSYETRYCIKDLMTDTCHSVKRFSGSFQEDIRGRHVLEVQLVFKNPQDLQRLQGLKMRIQRPHPYLNYRDQHYLFKKSA